MYAHTYCWEIDKNIMPACAYWNSTSQIMHGTNTYILHLDIMVW